MSFFTLNDKEDRKFRDTGRGHASAVVDETAYATKITVSGSITYIAKADPGTAQSAASWQAMKVDETDGTVITWADDGNYTQVATDLTALEYS